MKRRLLIGFLTVALTLTLIPAISAFADTDGDGLLGIFTEEQEDAGDAVEEADEGEDTELAEELPKLNLKSPVAHFGPGDLGETYTLTPRIGEERVDPLLIAWTTSDPSVATVSEDGTVTVVGLGRAEITAVMLDGSALPGKAKVFVQENRPDKDKEGDDQDEDSNKGKEDNPGKKHGKDKDREDADEECGDPCQDEDSQGEDADDESDGEDEDSQGDEAGEDGDSQGEDGEPSPENASGDE